MKKKIFSIVLTAGIAAGILAGCGSSSQTTTADTAATTADTTASAATTEAAADTATTAAADTAATTAAADGELIPITVAASPTPHAEILAQAKDALAAEGYDLQVTEFEDYVQPNLVVDQGEYEANYFQHIAYLDSFNEEQGTDLVVAGKIHYEPFGIYGGTKTDLASATADDTIAVPNDTTNEARALLLLQDNGLIKLKDDIEDPLLATVNDIDWDNSLIAKGNIVELEAAQVPKVLGENSYAVINGNYAMEAGLSVAKDALATENADSEAIKTYVNVIAVKNGNENEDKIKALVDVLKSDEIQKYITDTYDGAVVPYTGD